MITEKYIFDSKSINPDLKSSQAISTDWIEPDQKAAILRLKGGSSLTSVSNQSLLGRPIVDNHITAITKIGFQPTSALQAAGLVSFFGYGYWQFLSITAIDKRKHLQINTCTNFEVTNQYKYRLNPEAEIGLKISIESDKILFYYSEVKHRWHLIAQTLKIDRSKINDQSLLGICCVDHYERNCYAEFEYLTYQKH